MHTGYVSAHPLGQVLEEVIPELEFEVFRRLEIAVPLLRSRHPLGEDASQVALKPAMAGLGRAR